MANKSDMHEKIWIMVQQLLEPQMTRAPSARIDPQEGPLVVTPSKRSDKGQGV